MNRFLPFTLLLSVLLFVNCKQNKCKTTQCPPSAFCSNGYCICQSGYEGQYCDIVSRDKIIGTYKGTMEVKFFYPDANDTTSKDTDVVVTITANTANEGVDGIVVITTNSTWPLEKNATVKENTFSNNLSGPHGNPVYTFNGSVQGQNIEFIYTSAGASKYTFIGTKQ